MLPTAASKRKAPAGQFISSFFPAAGCCRSIRDRFLLVRVSRQISRRRW
jgi:hypothetical protein